MDETDYPELRPAPLPKKTYYRNIKRFRGPAAGGNRKGWKHSSGRPHVYRKTSGKNEGKWEVRFVESGIFINEVIGPAYTFSRLYDTKMAAVYVANLVWRIQRPALHAGYGELTHDRYLKANLREGDRGFIFVWDAPGSSVIRVDPEEDVWDRMTSKVWFWGPKSQRYKPSVRTIDLVQKMDGTLSTKWVLKSGTTADTKNSRSRLTAIFFVLLR